MENQNIEQLEASVYPSGFPPLIGARFALQATIVSLTCASDQVLGQCQGFSFAIIPAPECPIFGPMAMGSDAITENGLVCGTLVDCDSYGQPFLWTGKEVKIIATPSPYLEAWANNANSQGHVVGLMSDGNSKAFLYDGNQVVNLGTLSGGSNSEAMAINNNGIVVGWSTAPGALRAVRWENGGITPLGLPVGPSSTAIDTNDLNQIVGWMGVIPGPQFGGSQAFLWHNGTTTPISCPPEAVSCDARAINNKGVVILHAIFPSSNGSGYDERTCLWHKGICTDLPLLPGCTNSNATDINDYNMIIEGCSGPNGAGGEFLLWNGKMIDYLQDIPSDMGLKIFGVSALNNAGQLMGDGLDADNNPIAFILTPIPSAPGDFDCDQDVDVDDLLAVINHWGITGGGPADFDNDKAVGLGDLLVVINNWTF